MDRREAVAGAHSGAAESCRASRSSVLVVDRLTFTMSKPCSTAQTSPVSRFSPVQKDSAPSTRRLVSSHSGPVT